MTRKLLDSYPPVIPEDAVQLFISSIASATNFLQGSTSKRIPYEIAYCLKLAGAGWTTKPPLITTALSPNLYQGFYFQGVSPSFYTLADLFLDVRFSCDLVQISLPDMYRRRPLYCTPLYHELGHFVDIHHDITGRSLLIEDQNKPLPSVNLAVLNEQQKSQIQRSHRMEYFADLFSAMFTGTSGREFLLAFAGAAPASATHPATVDRVRVIDEFLSGAKNSIIDLFQASIGALGLPTLEPKYTSPNISDFFGNARPYPICNEAELHGLFDAAWSYLRSAWDAPQGKWIEFEKPRREESVNDLVEKSIRNYMIKEKWQRHEAT